MKTMLMAAVAAVTLGMTGAALADQVTDKQPASGQSQSVMPNQRAGYLARNESVLPSQRPAYLARNESVLPSQRPAYLARNESVLPSQRPAYLA
ncbi:hypothetical protein [Acidisoma sp. 7E03]